MSRIYWDTLLFIYMIEGDPQFGAKVRRISKRMRERGDTLCTSVFAFAEVLTGAVKGGEPELARDLRSYFRSHELELLPFTADMAERFAEIRGKNNLSEVDTIHLATAAHAGVDLFLTNDKRLHRLIIPGISFIAGLDGTIF
jgi:predicted nucleic acid-binding protein